MSHQLTGLFGRVCAARFAEPKELDHVQAAFAQFEASNQTAFAPEFGRQLALGQSGLVAQRDQHFPNAFILPRIDCFIHARMLRALGLASKMRADTILLAI